MDFHLSICGEGESKQAMSRTIQAEQLGRYVSLNGILEFKTELVPFVKSDIDLFICCHSQGDPSCTYLETMSSEFPLRAMPTRHSKAWFDRLDAGGSLLSTGLTKSPGSSAHSENAGVTARTVY